jgi:putative peptide zinc metalloprotease protein
VIHPPGTGSSSWILQDRASSRYFRVGAVEASILRELDGRRTLAEVRAATLAAIPAISLSPDAVVAFASRAAGLGWLAGHSPKPRRPRAANPLRLQLPFGSPERLLRALDPVVRQLYRPPVLAALLAGLSAAAMAAGAAMGWSLGRVVPSGVPGWLLTWVAFALVSAVHEFGHTLTLRFFGGRSGPMGFMLLYGIPCFYCDVSDAWRLPRRERLLVGIAGLGWQFAAGALAFAFLSLLPPNGLPGQLARAAVGLCGLTGLLNLNPLIRLDGYWLLCDALDLPNLRRRSFTYLRGRLAAALLPGAALLSPPDARLTLRERWIFMAYGVAASAYTTFLAGVLLLGAGRWMGQLTRP